MNTFTFLKKIFPETQFSAEELDQILPKFKRKEFSKHEFLLEAGRTANYYFFIESGFVRSYALDTEGKDISTNFYTTGDIVIDWPSFFLRIPTKEATQALTDGVCWQLDYDSFQQLFHHSEAFREAGRTRLVGSYFELKNKSISMITDQAKDRYKRLLEEKPQIVQNVSLKQIATYLGITDTSLSRIRKEMSKE